MTNAEAWFNNSLHPRIPEGSLGRTAQDGHLDPHTAPELWTLSTMFTYLHALCPSVSHHNSYWYSDTDSTGESRISTQFIIPIFSSSALELTLITDKQISTPPPSSFSTVHPHPFEDFYTLLETCHMKTEKHVLISIAKVPIKVAKHSWNPEMFGPNAARIPNVYPFWNANKKKNPEVWWLWPLKELGHFHYGRTLADITSA